MSDNTPDYKDNLYFDSQNTKNEQQKDLCITIEQQVWASTLHRSMMLQAENEQLKKLLKEIKGKIHYINTPKNQHNICSNNIIKRIDEVLK